MFGITTIPGLVALFTIVGAILSFYIYDYLGIKSKRVKVAEAKDSFDKIVGNLSSADNTTKLAAAIMLRRFLDGQNKRKRTFLFQESVNVISSMLKVLPTGIFQKTLADGLAHAGNLARVDLQKTKLQDVFEAMHKELGESEALSPNSDPNAIKEFFAKVLPTYDRDRFYVSHMKKVLSWYNELLKYASLDFAKEEDTQAEDAPAEKAE